jgi:hypothetical protein
MTSTTSSMIGGTQGEIADPSSMFFTERCHPIREGGFHALATPLRQVV